MTETIDVNTTPVAVTPDSKVREWFGGWNSLTGFQAPFHGVPDIPLPERDPLADPGGGGRREPPDLYGWAESGTAWDRQRG